MTGTTHLLAGAAMGKILKNPVLAIIIGFLIHFIMDLVPHWDLGYLFCKKWTCYLMAMSDPIFGIAVLVILGLIARFDKKTWIIVFLGGLSSIAPDVMSVIIRTFHIEWMRWFLEIHRFAHYFQRSTGDVFAWGTVSFTIKQMLVGLAVQVPFLALSIWILLRDKRK